MLKAFTDDKYRNNRLKNTLKFPLTSTGFNVIIIVRTKIIGSFSGGRKTIKQELRRLAFYLLKALY